MTPLLTPADVARLLAISRNSVYAIPLDQLPCVRVGGARRYHEADVVKYVAARTQGLSVSERKRRKHIDTDAEALALKHGL